MSKIIIQTPVGELDISKDIGFGLTYAVQDLVDPSKRKSAFSKSIILPGTKNNNNILGNLFDINEDFTFFNPNIKIDAKIIIDSTTIIDGFLQLKKIDKLNDNYLDGNTIQYNVVVNDNSIDLMSILGDKLLNELDLSVFDHLYSKSVIEDSWTNTYVDGYVYPLLWNGGNNDYETKDFKTCIFLRTYLEKIINEAGYSLGGSFLDNELYKREIMPYNGVMTITPEEVFRRKLWVGTKTQPVINTYRYLDEQLDSTLLDIDYLTDETNSPFFDDNNHWDGTSWTVDRTGNYDLNLQLNMELKWDTNFNITGFAAGAGNTVVTLPNHRFTNGMTLEIYNTTDYNGTYVISNITTNTFTIPTTFVTNETNGKIRINATQGWFKLDNNGNVYATGINNPPRLGIYTYMYINGVPWGGSSLSFFGAGLIDITQPLMPYSLDAGTFTITNGPGLLFHSGNGWSQSKLETLNINIPNEPFNTNDVITFKHKVIWNPSNSLHNDWVDVNSKKVPANFTWKIGAVPFNGTDSQFKVNPPASTLTNDDAIVISNVIPEKIKQKDIIIDLFKRYNVIMHQDPNDSKKILLDSRDDYYAAGALIDWTDKKDYSKKDVITFLSDLQTKEILYTYKKDKDDRNKQHTEKYNGDIFGQNRLVYDNEFVKGTKKIESIFSPTISVFGDSLEHKVVPFIGTGENVRVLQYGGLKPSLNNSTWDLNWVDTTTFFPTPNITTYTTYPYAGHLDDPFTGETSNLYGNPLNGEYYAGVSVESNDNLFNKYWRNYANEIGEGKLVTSYFYLTPVDISYIKNNMNAKIFIKDSYYHVSKIYDYNPIKNTLTKVDLIKVVETLSFVKKLKTIPIKSTTDTILTNRDGGLTTNAPVISVGTSKKNNLASTDLLVNGSNNNVAMRTNGSMIIGNFNRIGPNADNVGIIGGDKNIIAGGVGNSYIIASNNRVVTKSNEVWIGDLHIVDGVVVSSADVIEGGLNEVRSLFPQNSFEVIEGGLNELRTSFPNNIENYIDGGEVSI